MEARQSQSARCTWLVLSLQSPRSLVVLEMLSRMILFGNPGVRRPDGVRIGQMGELHQIVPDSSTSWLLQLASAVVCKRSASPQVHPIAACLYVALPSHVPPKYLSHPTPAFSILSLSYLICPGPPQFILSLGPWIVCWFSRLLSVPHLYLYLGSPQTTSSVSSTPLHPSHQLETREPSRCRQRPSTRPHTHPPWTRNTRQKRTTQTPSCRTGSRAEMSMLVRSVAWAATSSRSPRPSTRAMPSSTVSAGNV